MSEEKHPDRVDEAGLGPAESVAGGFGNPLRVPIDRVDEAGLAPAESVAGGFGNPLQVPIQMRSLK